MERSLLLFLYPAAEFHGYHIYIIVPQMICLFAYIFYRYYAQSVPAVEKSRQVYAGIGRYMDLLCYPGSRPAIVFSFETPSRISNSIEYFAPPPAAISLILKSWKSGISAISISALSRGSGSI